MDDERKGEETERQHKPNLQGILKYAIQNSSTEVSTRSITSAEMDVERKKFLENVLQSMAVDVVAELHKAINTLEAEDSEIEEKIHALSVVRDLADSIDFANSFIQIGGSKVVLKCLKSKINKLRVGAAYVIAELSQNNPFCQQHFLDAGALQELMVCTKEDGDVASSCMHAISALVRNFEPGSAKFIELRGLECILERLHSSHSIIFVKCCFLMRALAVEFESIRDEFVKLGAIGQLAAFVDPVMGFDIKTETVLSALCLLTESKKGKVLLKKTDIADTLRSIIAKNDGKEECEEILRDSKILLEHLKK